MRHQKKTHSLRAKLIIAVPMLVVIFAYVAPGLYAGATIGFPNPGKLGPYLSVHSTPNAVFALLLAALIALAIWRSGRRRSELGAEELPVWICPACHEENPGNFGECWKCQRIRTHETEEK